MGYYVEVVKTNAFIPSMSIEAACRALERMFNPEIMKANAEGGRFRDGEKKETWYSWVDTNACLELLKENNLEGFLEGWMFDPYEIDGDLYLGGYDSKSGDEGFMLQVIAPFVAEGSYIIWRGEEGEMWANVFKGGKMSKKNVDLTVRD